MELVTLMKRKHIGNYRDTRTLRLNGLIVTASLPANRELLQQCQETDTEKTGMVVLNSVI